MFSRNNSIHDKKTVNDCLIDKQNFTKIQRWKREFNNSNFFNNIIIDFSIDMVDRLVFALINNILLNQLSD